MIFVSQPTDTAYFGGTPFELVSDGSPLSKLRTLSFTVISGLLFLAGCLFAFVAWFGLRQGGAWALVALGVTGLSAIAYWALALLPCFRSGIRVTLDDLPPFIWISALLILPAILLGWIGLR